MTSIRIVCGATALLHANILIAVKLFYKTKSRFRVPPNAYTAFPGRFSAQTIPHSSPGRAKAPLWHGRGCLFAQPKQPLYTTQSGTLAPQKRHFTVRHAPRQHAQAQSHGRNAHAANPLRLHTQKGRKNGQASTLRAELPRTAATPCKYRAGHNPKPRRPIIFCIIFATILYFLQKNNYLCNSLKTSRNITATTK